MDLRKLQLSFTGRKRSDIFFPIWKKPRGQTKACAAGQPRGALLLTFLFQW